jgi:hypothetical protein
MMISRHLLSTPILLLASACAVTGPIYDRSFEKAPFAACADLTETENASVGQAPVRIGCFEAVARTYSAGQQISAAEHKAGPDGLRLAGAAALRLAGGEGCTGRFSNFVIEYTAPVGAGATVTATDGLGRHLGTRRIEAEPSPKLRRLVIREMSDPLKDPTIAEFTNVKGELFVRSVCLKGY